MISKDHFLVSYDYFRSEKNFKRTKLDLKSILKLPELNRQSKTRTKPNCCTIKHGYNGLAWDRINLFVINNRKGLSVKIKGLRLNARDKQRPAGLLPSLGHEYRYLWERVELQSLYNKLYKF